MKYETKTLFFVEASWETLSNELEVYLSDGWEIVYDRISMTGVSWINYYGLIILRRPDENQ